jgi:glycerophosphoryl diester phosphodiesterase
VDGRQIAGWFTEDLTLAQLKTLRAEERLPDVRQESTVLDGRYEVPTLDEVLALAKAASRREGREIGVAPETKHPTYFDRIGLSLEERLLADLREANLDKAHSPVFVQSFEEANLRELRALGAEVRLVQLTSARGRPYDHVVAGDPQTYADMTTPAGLAEIATYADVLGPDKNQVLPRDAAGRTGARTSLVADAHAADLQVVPYTVRAENQFLPAQYRSSADGNAFGDVLAELHDLFDAGVDGVFADQPDLAVIARDER